MTKQSVMSKKLSVTKRRVGRPAVTMPRLKKSISLAPDVHDYLLKIGQGSLSGGVALATKFHAKFFSKVPKEVK